MRNDSLLSGYHSYRTVVNHGEGVEGTEIPEPIQSAGL